MKSTIIVLVGPSGSGKTTAGFALEEHDIPKLITTTTRAKREGEEEAVDYYFIDSINIKEEDFVESTIYNNEYYGLTRSEVDRKTQEHPLVHVAMDKNGVESLRKAYPGQIMVVYFKITKEQMICRMQERGDNPTLIAERVDHVIVANEAKMPPEVDTVIENMTVEETVDKILNLIKEKQR